MPTSRAQWMTLMYGVGDDNGVDDEEELSYRWKKGMLLLLMLIWHTMAQKEMVKDN